MNFSKIFFSILIGACLAPAANAKSTVPNRHSAANAIEARNNGDAVSNFVERSYEAARLHSPFASVQPVKVESRVNLELGDKMVNYAKKFLGTPYVWGATGPKAFDCSGFTSYVYRNFGITINRTSRMQYLQGEKVNISQLQPGDLLFFSSRRAGRGNVGHVAMVASVDRKNNTCTFIHASVKRGVTYQKFPDNGYFSRNFIGAKRIIGHHNS